MGKDLALLHHKILVGEFFGTVDYESALDRQLRTHRGVLSGTQPHSLLLLEHPPVYTLGKRASEKNILTAKTVIEKMGARVLRSDRGGDVTFHGPGQLVGYPIVNIKALGKTFAWYIGRLLEAVCGACQELGVATTADMERPGVYVASGEKIGSVGVRLSQGVTYHGFSLNVGTDLSWYDHIVACGLRGVGATSLEKELGTALSLAAVGDLVGKQLAQRMGLEWQV